MCGKRLLWVWVLWGLSSWAFGQVTEQERQAALQAFNDIETYTQTLQANSKARETYLTETENSLNERQSLLAEREKLLSEKEASVFKRENLQTEKENSLLDRENSLQVMTTLMQESKKLYDEAVKHSKVIKVLGVVGGVMGAGLGFLLGRL